MRIKLGYLRLQQKKSRKVLLSMKIKPERRWYRSVALFFKFDCISVANLSMYFVDCFNLANVENIMLVFIRIVVYFIVFLLIQGEITTTTSVRWKIRKNLTVKTRVREKWIVIRLGRRLPKFLKSYCQVAEAKTLF